MTRPARASIDLRALRENFDRVRQSAPASQVMAIVKANAYGHGLLPVAQALPDADAFGVVGIEEGITLREAGFDRRIVLLEGPFEPADLNLVSGYRLDVVIHHAEQLAWLEQVPLARPLDVWLKINTGMHRLGFAPAAAADIAARMAALDQVREVRFMTHFACADEPDNPVTATQLERFDTALNGLAGERSLANSAAVLHWPQTHADWVRPGIMLYGASPFSVERAETLGLRPVMTFSSRLIAVNACRKGDTVGYGGSWQCPEDMDIGVAAVGYGDGYPRHAGNGMPVLVNGRRAQLAGRVSMDMITIDLRSVPGSKVGDEVVLWGGELPVDEVAAGSGTIAYELLCGISGRVALEYST